MRIIIYWVLCLCCMAGQLSAQSLIPLDVPVQVKLTARDTGMLHAYNLYEFDYISNSDTFRSAFIVPKTTDSVVYSSNVNVILGRITEFMIFPPGRENKGLVIPASEGVEVSNADEPGKKSYLNFDPAQPETVFLLKSFDLATVNE